MPHLFLKPINRSSLSELTSFYTRLANHLADLNAAMMVAWQSVLDLKYHIDQDGILYVVGFFENEYWGWGPPIGPHVEETHVEKLLNTLDELNNKPSSILYLWGSYQLFHSLHNSSSYNISDQSTEYIYSSKKIASLPRETMKSFRKKKDIFCRKNNPKVQKFSSLLASDCMHILEKWLRQKQDKVARKYLDKIKLEADVCKFALQENLPLSGVIVYVNDLPEAFSLGVELSKSCFNCMFEKTNLQFDGLSVFVFSELAEIVKNEFEFINAGEDWGVSYLKESKLKWQPSQIQKSYQLSRNVT